MAALLEVENLSVCFDTAQGTARALRGVSLSVAAGEVLAVVGESGCGKSVLCRSIMGLLPRNAHITDGNITVDGTAFTRLRERELQQLRGWLAAMVPQDPMDALNPAMPIGKQIAEAVRTHSRGIRRAEVRGRVLELLRMVGVDRPEQRIAQYPCHLSGGLRQRCVLAAALAASPRLLLADEPTTALDATVQAQILELFGSLRRRLGMAALFVTHDLGVVARVADRVAVMYAGRIVETGTAEEIFYSPRHPYTWGLLRALPSRARAGEPLYTIPGMPPTLFNMPAGDAFACRNEYALAVDYEEQPPMFRLSDTHYAATWLLDERAPPVVPPVGGGDGA